MKTLLVVPPKERYFGLAQYPPVGLGYLAAWVRRLDNQEVEILDCVKRRLDLKGFEEYIKNKEFDIIGFTVWSLAIKEVKETLRIAKKIRPQAVTIIGGPHPSALPEQSMAFFAEADFGFKGEGEIGFPQFVDVFQKGITNWENIPGLIWRTDKGININQQAWVQDLDELGFPSWDLLNPREYFMPGSLIGRDTAVLACTRGCSFSCTFCSAWIIAGKRVRKRSVLKILEEIDFLSSNYGIRIFDIPDENFTFDKAYVIEFCRAVIDKYGKKFEFFLPNGMRLDSLDQELLQWMKKANFRSEIAVGIESGSERILKLMKKNLTLDEVRAKIKLMNDNGFRPIGYFILGFPGETVEDINRTIRLSLELKLSAAAFTPFAPMPGTEATNNLIKNRELPLDFDFTEVSTDVVAYAPQGMTREQLDRLRKIALLKFNLRPHALRYYLKKSDSFKFAAAKFINLFIKGGQVHSKEYADN